MKLKYYYPYYINEGTKTRRNSLAQGRIIRKQQNHRLTPQAVRLQRVSSPACKSASATGWSFDYSSYPGYCFYSVYSILPALFSTTPFWTWAKSPLGDVKDPHTAELSPSSNVLFPTFSRAERLSIFDLKGLLFQLNYSKQSSYLHQPST